MTTKKVTNLVIFNTTGSEPQLALFGMSGVNRSVPYLEIDSIEAVLRQFKFRLTVNTSITSEIHAYNNAITLQTGENELHLVEHRNHFDYVLEDGTVVETYIYHVVNDLELISIGSRNITGWTSFTDMSDYIHRDSMPNHNAFLSELINAICHTSWS